MHDVFLNLLFSRVVSGVSLPTFRYQHLQATETVWSVTNCWVMQGGTQAVSLNAVVMSLDVRTGFASGLPSHFEKIESKYWQLFIMFLLVSRVFLRNVVRPFPQCSGGVPNGCLSRMVYNRCSRAFPPFGLLRFLSSSTNPFDPATFDPAISRFPTHLEMHYN